MPCLVLIIGSLFIKAFSMWLKLQEIVTKTDDKSESSEDNEEKRIEASRKLVDDPRPMSERKDKSEEFDVGSIASEILWNHLFGVAVMSSPKFFTYIGTEMLHWTTEKSIYWGFAATSIFTLAFFLGCKRYILLNQFKINKTSLRSNGLKNFHLRNCSLQSSQIV